jgi:hypothetical protein
VEGEEMAMATRTTSLKEIATIAAKKGTLKQRVGCFPVMQVRDQHGLSPEMMETGIGGGFVNTEELHVMNYNKAIKAEKEKWDYAVKEEHDRMVNNKVWTPVPIDKIPEGTKIMTSAWAMKKKPNGIYRARVNARGFEQIDGEHCDLDTKSSPVTRIVTIRIVMTLIVMAAWAAHLMDVH